MKTKTVTIDKMKMEIYHQLTIIINHQPAFEPSSHHLDLQQQSVLKNEKEKKFDFSHGDPSKSEKA